MRIFRLLSLNVACLLVFFLHVGYVSADSAKRLSSSRPNIIVILADDLGFSDLGCYGSEINTPALDRMADEGLRFTQFYNGARCCPTRAALLTGLYPHQAGIGYMTGNVGSPAYQGYLQWTHEGGIASPLVAWWPDGIMRPGRLNHEPGHVIDIMATCLDVAGVPYPVKYNGKTITALEGKTLAPAFSGRQRGSHEAIFWEHMGSKAVRQGKWKLVAQREIQEWELYDMETDRTELHDLADRHLEKVSEMAALYEVWAKKVGVRPWQDILEMKRSQ